MASLQQEFLCPACNHSVPFSLGTLRENCALTCSQCEALYAIDETLQNQIRRFSSLCEELQRADEAGILGSSAIGIDINGNHVEIPYNLLLTRFRSTLTLLIEGETPPPTQLEIRLSPLS